LHSSSISGTISYITSLQSYIASGILSSSSENLRFKFCELFIFLQLYKQISEPHEKREKSTELILTFSFIIKGMFDDDNLSKSL